MATKTRREFTPESKREAVASPESGGRPRMRIAAELGIQPSVPRNRRAALNGGTPSSRPATSAATAPSPAASPAGRAAEIARLRRGPERARAERDILEKAIGIFSETPR